MDQDKALREQLQKILDWQDAHANFDFAVKDVPLEQQGVRLEGFPHSAWQLLEHIRITQADILEFSIDPNYQEKQWPDDYWPESPAPPSGRAWHDSVDACLRDREALKALCRDPGIDLFATIPQGSGQTYLREMLVVADHTSYHVGQLVMLRRQLGIWSSA